MYIKSNKENSPTSKEHASQQSTLLSKTVKKKSELLPTSSRNGQRKKIVDAVKVTAETKRPQRSGCANSRNNGSGRTTAVLRCAQKQVNSTNRSQRRIVRFCFVLESLTGKKCMAKLLSDFSHVCHFEKFA